MKKKIIIAGLLSLILLCLNSCLNRNIDSQIVGEWQSENFANSNYVFKSDGTFERTTAFNRYYEGKYTAVDGILTLDYGEEYEKQEIEYKFNNDTTSYDYGDMKIGAEYFEKVSD